MIIKRNGADHVNLIQRGAVTIISAEQDKSILSDDSVTIRVKSNQPLDITVHDTFEVYGDVYRINSMPVVDKLSNSEYEYTIVGQGLMFDLQRAKFFNADGAGYKTEMEFSLIGDLELYLITIINNMQRAGDLWKIGKVAKTETKTISFSADNCLSALQKICQEFKIDFWVKNEPTGYTIHTGSFGDLLHTTFEYGKGHGLYRLGRSNVDENGVVNRLYVAGGEQNLPAAYRNFSRHLKFSDAGYLEDTESIAKIGLKEGNIDLPDIYPHRTGKVEKTEGLATFFDTTMDFDLNEKEADGVTTKYLVPGQTAKIHFNTGGLAGYEFEIAEYKHATKQFRIIPIKTDIGQDLPDKNEPAFQIQPGDEYVLLDIYMPQTYIANAEAALKVAAEEQFALNKNPKVNYDLEVDAAFLRQISKLPEIGDYVHVVDESLGVDKILRIKQITRNFIENSELTEYSYKISIADGYEVNFISQLALDVKEIRTAVRQIKLGQISLSRLGYRLTQDLKDLLFDPDGYFDTALIRPKSIETGMLAVGFQSQQISVSLTFETNVDSDPKKVRWNDFKLFSQTLDRVWLFPGGAKTVDAEPHYVYGQLMRDTGEATILISKEQLTYESNPNYYTVVLGILSRITEGVRLFVPTYGSSTIIGGLIRTGIISSNDGMTMLNLDTGEFTGLITFRDNSPAIEQISGGSENLVYDDGTNIFNFTPDNGRYVGKDMKYTFSLDVDNTFELDAATLFIIGYRATTGAEVIAKKEITLRNGVSRHHVTFSMIVDEWDKIFYKVIGAGDEDFPTAKPKLELGIVATDYGLPKEFIKDLTVGEIDPASLKRITDLETKTDFLKESAIRGNVMASGAVILGGSEGANAGITGLGSNDDVFFWGGANFLNRHTAPIRFYRNGTGVLKGVEIEGNINAGTIGGADGWIIDRERITSQGNGVISFETEYSGVYMGKQITSDITDGSFHTNFYIKNYTSGIHNGSNIGAKITVANGSSWNAGLSIDVERGAGVNSRVAGLVITAGRLGGDGELADALFLASGGIRLDNDQRGITKTVQVGNQKLYFRHGILVKIG